MGQPVGDLYTRVLKCCQLVRQGCTLLNFDIQLRTCVCLCCPGNTSDGGSTPMEVSGIFPGPFGALSSATSSLKSHLLHPHTMTHVQISIAGCTENPAVRVTSDKVYCLHDDKCEVAARVEKTSFQEPWDKVREGYYWRKKGKQHRWMTPCWTWGYYLQYIVDYVNMQVSTGLIKAENPFSLLHLLTVHRENLTSQSHGINSLTVWWIYSKHVRKHTGVRVNVGLLTRLNPLQGLEARRETTQSIIWQIPP